MTTHTIKKVALFLIIVAASIGTGWYANNWYHRNHVCTAKEKRIKNKNFQFISPLIDVELPEGYTVRSEPISFKKKIASFVTEQIDSGHVQDVSVYYRDLLDGPWFGINEDAHYNPASMMKVPILVAWLKRAEKDPSVLKRTLYFDEKYYHGPPQGFKPAQELKTGTSYTVDELLRYLMYYSDNRALWLLQSNMAPGEYDNVLENMDVPNERDASGRDTITIHSYSGFLRILFNASYLNKEMSEKALQLMSYEDFPQGIAAGIPKGITLASKFGEYSELSRPDIVQIHEFAIVYHPKGPYILGILTRGKNVPKQLEIIRNISRMTYDSVGSEVSNAGR